MSMKTDCLVTKAKKRAAAEGVPFMVYSCDNADGWGRGQWIAPLYYSDEGEFEAFDGEIEIIVHPDGEIE